MAGLEQADINALHPLPALNRLLPGMLADNTHAAALMLAERAVDTILDDGDGAF
jgi:hypothetical protein